MSVESNDRRIVKNTLILYIRTFLLIFVNLYVVRIVLRELGLEDYGIYNLIGGFVVMFSIIIQSLSSASQRFFAIQIGKGDFSQLEKEFSITFWSYLKLALGLFLIAEVVGIWFINYQLSTIPINRMNAVNYVFQFSLLSFLVSFLTIPFNALIIALEKMKTIAYVSFVEAIFKLLVAVSICYIIGDKLILYAFLMFVASTLVCILYIIKCTKLVPGLKIRKVKDKASQSDIMSYTGWNTLDSFSSVLSTQGVNMLLGIFLGPIVNSARALAYQISSTLNHFVLNFITASKPQIIKYYADGDFNNLEKLVFRSSKFSFFLLLFVSIPLFLYSDFVLIIWLGELPPYAADLTKIVLLTVLIEVLSYPILAQVQATGKIRKYNIVISLLRLTILPVTYYLLLFEFSVRSVFIANLILAVLCLFTRLVMINSIVNFDVKAFVKEVLLPVLFVFMLTFLLSFSLGLYASVDLIHVIQGLVLSYSSYFLAVMFVGTSKDEQNTIFLIIKGKIQKR